MPHQIQVTKVAIVCNCFFFIDAFPNKFLNVILKRKGDTQYF